MLSNISPLKLVKIIDLFEELKAKVERNIPEKQSQRMCMKTFFSDLN